MKFFSVTLRQSTSRIASFSFVITIRAPLPSITVPSRFRNISFSGNRYSGCDSLISPVLFFNAVSSSCRSEGAADAVTARANTVKTAAYFIFFLPF